MTIKAIKRGKTNRTNSASRIENVRERRTVKNRIATGEWDRADERRRKVSK